MAKKETQISTMRELLEAEIFDLESAIAVLKEERGYWAGRAFEAEEAFAKAAAADAGSGEEAE